MALIPRKRQERPQIIRIDLVCPRRALLKRAARVVLADGVIGYPTETVYGLGANPFSAVAVSRVFEMKGRDSKKPISVLVSDEQMLRELVREVPPTALRLMETFWPGPLTIVFKARQGFPKTLLGGGDSLAVRISSSRIVQALLNELKIPLTSTSANISGRSAACSALEVADQLGDQIDLIVDGGSSKSTELSSIVDVSSGKATILRAGVIGVEEIEKALGENLLSRNG